MDKHHEHKLVVDLVCRGCIRRKYREREILLEFVTEIAEGDIELDESLFINAKDLLEKLDSLEHILFCKGEK